MKKAIAILIIISGCYTQKKASQQVEKADKKYPEITAAFCKGSYPCIIVDSITHTDTLYNTIETEVPGETDTLRVKDTVFVRTNKVLTKFVNKEIIKTNTITVKDSAEIKILSLAITKANSDKEKYRLKAEKKSEWVMWLLIALGLSILGNVLQIKLKK